MLKQVTGDILKAKENIICHAVNCCGVMGAGLAGQIRDKYPHVYSEYNALYRNTPGNPGWNGPKPELLGTVQYVKVGVGQYIGNLFTQENFGRRVMVYTSYDAVRKCLETIRRETSDATSLAIPYGMCCGLARGDWNTVLGIIQDVFGDTKREVVIYRLSR